MKKLILLFLLMTTSVYAEESNIPELAPFVNTKAIYGKGHFKWFLFDVYDGILFCDAKTWSMDTNFALSLHYTRAISSEQFVKTSLEEMDKIQPLTQDERNKYQDYLHRIMPSVKEGDRITSLYIKNKGIKIYYNTGLYGEISDDIFARRFLAIWFSEKTSAPDFRNSLLHLAK